MDATCISCHYVFVYDSDFFEAKRLAPPRRCRHCRARRREVRRELTGRLTSTGPKFAVVRADDGLEFIASAVPHGLPLGTPVTFFGLPPEPGHGRGLADKVCIRTADGVP